MIQTSDMSILNHFESFKIHGKPRKVFDHIYLAVSGTNDRTRDLLFSEHFNTPLQVNDSKLYPSTAIIKSKYSQASLHDGNFV